MRKLILASSVGVVLFGLGALATAQNIRTVFVHADSVFREQPGLTDFAGNVRLTVDGVMVEADRIILEDGKATLQGHVRLTLPKGVRVSEVKDLRSVPPVPRSQP